MVWALVAASAVFWGLRLTQTAEPWVAPVLAPAPAPEIDTAAMARLLGAPPLAPASEAPTPANELVLSGIVASGAGQGAALISVRGRPPHPFRVGQVVAEGLVLQSVQARRALLGARVQGPASLALDLPPPPKAGAPG